MSVPGAVADPQAIHVEDVSFPSAGATIGAVLARPNRPGRWPGVIVLHDAFGLSDHFRDVAGRFANLGYIAVAPDMYTRQDTSQVTDRPGWFAVHFTVPDSQVVADIQAAATFLRGRDDATGNVGAIGFCGGGRQAILAACSPGILDAAIACWPGYITDGMPNETTNALRPNRIVDLIPNLSCPLYAVGGRDDTNPSPADLALLETQLRENTKTGAVEIFEDAGHAFFADYRPEMYKEPAAFALWPKVVSFFAVHLRAG